MTEKANLFKQIELNDDDMEVRLNIDATQFKPGKCNVKDGIIYDSITEVTDEYILLSSCNGAQEKIYGNGTVVYLPAGGGEAWSVRVEEL